MAGYDYLFPAKYTAYNVMLKPIGPVCNLNCTYCYYLEKKNLYLRQKDFRMNDDVLERFIKEYIESQNVPVISFVWQGGEPTLLGLDYYKKALELQGKHARGKRIENVFQTNGTLLTDEFCKFFAENNFLVGVSIDGPKELHDKHRTYRSGGGSFDEIMAGIKLLKKYKVEFNTLSVVNKDNSYFPLEVYRFLKEIGSGFIQFIPIVERVADTPDPEALNLVTPAYSKGATITDWSVEAEQYGHFLTTIFDEWVRNDVGRYYVQIFDVTLANWVGERPGLCVFSETCGDATAMEHNGDLYSCDHFVYSDYYLGNIMDTPLIDMIKSERQVDFGLGKRNNLPAYCIDCEYRFTCHGECPKNRIAYAPDGEYGLNYLCPAYKMFFAHVHPYMQYMADQLKKKQPPANIMNWVRHMDAKKMQEMNPGKEVGRNDPCHCGSGKKFKNCCIHILKKS
ncbi:MAG: anaerobic sulfatase-maturation protein [Bacteroidota bacterium]